MYLVLQIGGGGGGGGSHVTMTETQFHHCSSGDSSDVQTPDMVREFMGGGVLRCDIV